MINIYELEEKLNQDGYKYIAGCDEAGRGPMAGPLVAACVVLPVGYRLEKLNDSKKLSSKIREELYNIIIKDAIEVQSAFIDVEEVDYLNVYEATKVAMKRCIKKLKTKVDIILADALTLNTDIKCLNIIKGDQKASSIAAASIIAKVERDRYMMDVDAIYPQYNFRKHKGYVTREHLENLNKYGPSPIHRRSFAPVRRAFGLKK